MCGSTYTCLPATAAPCPGRTRRPPWTAAPSGDPPGSPSPATHTHIHIHPCRLAQPPCPQQPAAARLYCQQHGGVGCGGQTHLLGGLDDVHLGVLVRHVVQAQLGPRAHDHLQQAQRQTYPQSAPLARPHACMRVCRQAGRQAAGWVGGGGGTCSWFSILSSLPAVPTRSSTRSYHHHQPQHSQHVSPSPPTREEEAAGGGGSCWGW